MSGVTAGQQGDAGQQGEQSAEAGTGPDFGAMQAALAEQGSTLSEMRDFLQSSPWQDIQQAQGDDDQSDDSGLPDDIDLSFLDPDTAAQMDPQQLEQRLQSVIQAQAQKVAQDMVNPVRAEVQEMRHQQEVQALVGEFPEMAEPETAQAVLKNAGELAQQIAQSVGQPELAERLAGSPQFWRTTYMAGRAADAAQQEGEDIAAPATLESGAGGTPGGGGGDLGDQIIGARRGASTLPF